MFDFAAFRTRPKFLAVSPGSPGCALLLTFCLAASFAAFAQNPPQTSSNSPAGVQVAPAAQKLPPVTTTVIVHGETSDDYLPESLTVGTLDGAEIKNAPVSATVVTRDLLNDQVSRLLSDVVKNDASIGDDYVAVGYYGWFQIRGFPIDLATGLEINGLTVAGEQDVPLENKESVEFLKGIAGLESGVANAGGLIDYVTKRPAVIKAIDLATDHRGSAYGAADLGHLFGVQKQVGVRLNLAGERIVPYMNDTNGWRGVGALATDFRFSPATILKTDFEYQYKTERDGSGYQLLGGTSVPDINRIYRSTMLGDQPWGLPDIYSAFNTSLRLDHTFSTNWSAFAAAGLSRSDIQDNVIYAYGTSFDPVSGLVNCPNAPYASEYFFCPDGTYGVYDYRDPGELRIDAQAEAMLVGRFHTGALAHDVVLGGELFLRSVQEPGAPPPNAPSSVADGAVYYYVGSENIYAPSTPIDLASAESPLQFAGPRTLWEDSHQSAGIIQDRIHVPGRIQLIAGARADSLRDNNYSAGIPTHRFVWLPQFAVTFNPISTLTLYSNYGVLLSLGPQGPWWTDNPSQFLSPFFTRQAEVGAKYSPAPRILLTAAIYRMRSPFFYPKTLAGPDTFCPAGAAGDQCFESEGRETHNGFEFSAEGKAANWLRLNASAAAISAISTDTGTPAYNNQQVINIPRLHTTFFADMTLPRFHSLHLMPGWSFSGRKDATRDDTVSVASVNLFNLGASYKPGGEKGRVTIHLYADNILNKRYWSDTGANGGDTFIWLGAPTTVRLSAHYTF